MSINSLDEIFKMKQYPRLRIKILKDLNNNHKDNYAYKISKRLSTSYSNIYLEINNMLECGLIKISKESKNNNPHQKIRYYKLTNAGKDLARLYLEIDKIYQNLL